MSFSQHEVPLHLIDQPPHGRVRSLDGRLLLEQDPDGRYTVIEGDALYFRATEAGLLSSPAFVRKLPADPLERLHRHYKCPQLTPIEEARALAELQPQFGTQRELAAYLGTTQSHVSKTLSLLWLPRWFQEDVHECWLTVEDALILARKYRHGPVSASRPPRRRRRRSPVGA